MKDNYDLKEVTINEWIWIIFVILSLANIYGDELEKQSLQEKECRDKNARKIFLITASIALIIYLYFAIHSYSKLKKMQFENKNTEIQEINLLGNCLVFLGALTLIYSNIKNKNETTTEIP